MIFRFSILFKFKLKTGYGKISYTKKNAVAPFLLRKEFGKFVYIHKFD